MIRHVVIGRWAHDRAFERMPITASGGSQRRSSGMWSVPWAAAVTLFVMVTGIFD
jgi:hypothetical protein